MRLRRIMIAAPKSGSGKTTITCALLKALKKNGQQVVSYKCGPDYIDPMFHEMVLAIPSKNLDTFFTGEEKTRELLIKNRTEEDFAVLEGVMGLFDGLGGIRQEGSSYHLAEITGTPIILVVDAKGMGRSVLPLIAGFLAYDKAHLIRGVILNRMSKSSYEILKPLIEKELQINVLGYFRSQKDLHIESRHLGLVMPDELKDIREQIDAAAEELTKTVAVSSVMQIAENASELEREKWIGDERKQVGKAKSGEDVVIAVARDEAFCFYYADNLRMLEENGATLKYFSPLHDAGLPQDCHALLIGGGYPELYARELSDNYAMREAVRQAFDTGIPIVAECGGFMYLHASIMDKDGISHSMVGVLSGSCHHTGRLVRFGYIEIREAQSCFLPEGERIKGHEFHYYDSTQNGENCIASKPVTGKEYNCVIETENCWLGFPHLYYPSNPIFAQRFVEKAKLYKRRKE